MRLTYNCSNYSIYDPLGPELFTTTEEKETTEEKGTTGKFFSMPCFASIFDLKFDHPLLSILYAMRLSVLYSEEPTTPTTTVVDKNGCDVCDPNCEDYIANNPDCEEGKEISFSYQIFNIYYYFQI